MPICTVVASVLAVAAVVVNAAIYDRGYSSKAGNKFFTVPVSGLDDLLASKSSTEKPPSSSDELDGIDSSLTSTKFAAPYISDTALE